MGCVIRVARNGALREFHRQRRRRTMKRTHAILVAGMLGAGATLLSPAPANAEAGYDTYGTELRGTNCNCTPAEEAATVPRQAPPKVARQASPTDIKNKIEGTAKLQR
jgi:hypothetical protein